MEALSIVTDSSIINWSLKNNILHHTFLVFNHFPTGNISVQKLKISPKISSTPTENSIFRLTFPPKSFLPFFTTFKYSVTIESQHRALYRESESVNNVGKAIFQTNTMMTTYVRIGETHKTRGIMIFSCCCSTHIIGGTFYEEVLMSIITSIVRQVLYWVAFSWKALWISRQNWHAGALLPPRKTLSSIINLAHTRMLVMNYTWKFSFITERETFSFYIIFCCHIRKDTVWPWYTGVLFTAPAWEELVSETHALTLPNVALSGMPGGQKSPLEGFIYCLLPIKIYICKAFSRSNFITKIVYQQVMRTTL